MFIYVSVCTEYGPAPIRVYSINNFIGTNFCCLLKQPYICTNNGLLIQTGSYGLGRGK